MTVTWVYLTQIRPILARIISANNVMQIKGTFLRKKRIITLYFSYGDTPGAWLAL